MHLPHGVRFLIALSVGLLFLVGPIWFLVRLARAPRGL